MGYEAPSDMDLWGTKVPAQFAKYSFIPWHLDEEKKPRWKYFPARFWDGEITLY